MIYDIGEHVEFLNMIYCNNRRALNQRWCAAVIMRTPSYETNDYIVKNGYDALTHRASTLRDSGRLGHREISAWRGEA